MKTEAQFDMFHASIDGRIAIEHARDELRRQADQLDQYLTQYNSTQRSPDERTSTTCTYQAVVVGYAINYVTSHVIPNLRLDILADAQARLMVAAKVSQLVDGDK